MEIKDKEDFDSSDENELSYEDGQASVDFDEGDIELEVVDDTPPEDRNRKPLDREVEDPTDGEIAEYSEKVQKRMKELTHARHDERRAKEAGQKLLIPPLYKLNNKRYIYNLRSNRLPKMSHLASKMLSGKHGIRGLGRMMR
jgi:hypothetical protein